MTTNIDDPRATAPSRLRRVQRGAFNQISIALVLLPLRLFLAAGWIRAGVEKVIEPSWWSGDALRGFLDTQHVQAITFFHPVMDHVIAPMAIEVAALVAISEVLIGIAIGIGRPLRPALWWGIVLNVSFLLAGRVNPSAFYLIMEIVLLHAVSSGLLVNTGEPSTRWSLAASVAWFLTAMHFIPYVHTLQPAQVIEDPAMMLLFLSTVLGVLAAIRWFHANDDAGTQSTTTTRLLKHWLLCRGSGDVGRERGDSEDDLHLTELFIDGVLVDALVAQPEPEPVALEAGSRSALQDLDRHFPIAIDLS